MIEDPSKTNRRKKILIGALLSFVLFIIYIGVMIYVIIRMGDTHIGISRFPGGTIIDLLFMFVAPIVFQIFAILFSLLLPRLYIQVAKWMKIGRYDIRVKQLDKKYSIGEFFSRSFYASLLSIALSIALNNFIFDLDPSGVGEALFIPRSMAFSSAAIGFILTPISILLITPAWILDDVGVVFLKKDNTNELSNGLL